MPECREWQLLMSAYMPAEDHDDSETSDMNRSMANIREPLFTENKAANSCRSMSGGQLVARLSPQSRDNVV